MIWRDLNKEFVHAEWYGINAVTGVWVVSINYIYVDTEPSSWMSWYDLYKKSLNSMQPGSEETSSGNITALGDLSSGGWFIREEAMYIEKYAGWWYTMAFASPIPAGRVVFSSRCIKPTTSWNDVSILFVLSAKLAPLTYRKEKPEDNRTDEQTISCRARRQMKFMAHYPGYADSGAISWAVWSGFWYMWKNNKSTTEARRPYPALDKRTMVIRWSVSCANSVFRPGVVFFPTTSSRPRKVENAPWHKFIGKDRLPVCISAICETGVCCSIFARSFSPTADRGTALPPWNLPIPCKQLFLWWVCRISSIGGDKNIGRCISKSDIQFW